MKKLINSETITSIKYYPQEENKNWLWREEKHHKFLWLIPDGVDPAGFYRDSKYFDDRLDERYLEMDLIAIDKVVYNRAKVIRKTADGEEHVSYFENDEKAYDYFLAIGKDDKFTF